MRKSGHVLESVTHRVSESVNGQARANGIESFGVLLKHGFYRTSHKMGAKHRPHFVNEFAGLHDIRELETLDQLVFITKGFIRKRLRYRAMVAG